MPLPIYMPVHARHGRPHLVTPYGRAPCEASYLGSLRDLELKLKSLLETTVGQPQPQTACLAVFLGKYQNIATESF